MVPALQGVLVFGECGPEFNLFIAQQTLAVGQVKMVIIC